jgi:inosose dehydratase
MRISSSPCSFGIYYGAADKADADLYLDTSKALGFDGVDLGPAGFLGTPAEVEAKLARLELGLAGAYITLAELGEPGSDNEQARLDLTADIFDRVLKNAGHLPKPVACLAGAADTAFSLPRWQKGVYGRKLDAQATTRLKARLGKIASRLADRGYRSVLHPHLATIFETYEDSRPFLVDGTIGLCLDTGHLWLVGEDPLDVVKDAASVDLVHLKGADRRVWRNVLSAGTDSRFPWRASGFCGLDQGDLETGPIVERIRQRGFSGWIVIEQDRPAGKAVPWQTMADEQAANLERLRSAWNRQK